VPRAALPLIAWVLATAAGCQPADEPRRSPNVVLFLVDDLGWSDVACYGSKVYRTPRIDELAERGVRMTDAYAAHPMCKASRYALMTGRSAARKRSSSGAVDTELDETTIAEAFRAEGYVTFFAGKWHIEHRSASPATYGFEVQVGVNDKGSPASYFFPYGEEGDARRVPLREGGEPGEYLTDRLTDETIDFIEAHRSVPFFVCLSHYAVHKPLEAEAELVAEYEEIIAATEYSGEPLRPVGPAWQKQFQDNPVYAAMVESVDQSLGRVVDALEELGLTKDTIVVFTSDNGGESCNTRAGEHNSTSNVPLKAGKYWLYEGGIRVPLVVVFPGRVPAGATSNAVAVGADHYPTLLELAGFELRPEDHLDGVSYVPALLGSKDWRRPPAFWHFPVDGTLAKFAGTVAGSAVRDGDYKLIEWYGSGAYELYDVRTDPGEEHDLRDEQPARAEAMLSRLREWRREVDAPL